MSRVEIPQRNTLRPRRDVLSLLLVPTLCEHAIVGQPKVPGRLIELVRSAGDATNPFRRNRVMW
jgi:hypothetical protein